MARRSINQVALAEAIGLTQPAVSRRLSGVVQWSASELLAVARTLGVDVAELYAGVEPASSAAPTGTEAVA